MNGNAFIVYQDASRFLIHDVLKDGRDEPGKPTP